MRIGPQAGILNRPPEHQLVAALAFVGERSRQPCVDTLEALRTVLRRELHSDIDSPDATTDKGQPFVETGELGFQDGFDRGHLTVTVSFSASAMDALEVPAALRPQDLVAAPWDALGIAPAVPAAGDVLVQICTDSPYVAEHVLRRIEHSLDGRMQVVWCVAGDQRFTSRSGRVNAGEARALNGFLDGTANLDPAQSDDDYALVFIDPDVVAAYPSNPPAGQQPQSAYGPNNNPVFPPLRDKPTFEPPWTRDGTYLFVQAIVLEVTGWDKTSLTDQEHAVGRYKVSGTALDLPDDPSHRNDTPAYAANPSDETVPVDSHIRKSNPRGPEDALRRIYRRGYPLMIADGSGAMRRGLLFESFSRSTSTQVEFILRAWMLNPDFPRPSAGKDKLIAFFSATLCGGYYFAPPLDHSRDPSSWRIPATT
ncbi:MAG TPA: Dyp-type peroxidase [Acidimicrobiia bacterium]|jgi:deferrochelatase/peroxidase EfeB